MSDVEVWASLEDFSTRWRQAPPVVDFADRLRARATPHATGFARQLQEMYGRYSMLRGLPLRNWSMLNFFSQSGLPGDMAWTAPEGEMAAFMQDAYKLEAAMLDSVHWVRSRLPGYPLIPAPQLARHAPASTTEFTWRIPWRREILSSGLQFSASPPISAKALNLSPEDGLEFNRSVSRLLGGLQQSDEWLRYVDTFSLLDNDVVRTDLRTARVAIGARLRPEEIDKYEPGRVLRRYEYRVSVVKDEISKLSGGAREFTDAFGLIDEKIEFVLSNVLGSLVINYPIHEIRGVEELALSPSDNGTTVEFLQRPLQLILDPGDVVFIDDPLVEDAVQLLEIEFSFSKLDGESLRLRGVLLPGSGDAWRPRES